MKAAVISDIHANLHALDAVLGEIDAAGVDEIWCLGDVVGYGAFPDECVMALKDRCPVFLLGNHDLAALREIDIGTFSPSASASARWTRDQLGDEAMAFLRGLDDRHVLALGRRNLAVGGMAMRDPGIGTGDCQHEDAKRDEQFLFQRHAALLKQGARFGNSAISAAAPR